VATDADESDLAYIPNVGATVANLTKRANEAMNPNAKGSRYMQLIITATSHQFDGGYLVTVDDLGEGFTYRIKGHTITSDNDPVTGNIYLDLYDPIHTAIDSTTDIAIAGCPYANLEAVPITTAVDLIVAGVTCTNMSANDYGWIQTRGPCGVLQDATLAIHGQAVTTSSNTAGSVSTFPYNTSHTDNIFIRPEVGKCIVPASSTAHSVVYLTLE
jgi:hypothetical protein